MLFTLTSSGFIVVADRFNALQVQHYYPEVDGSAHCVLSVASGRQEMQFL